MSDPRESAHFAKIAKITSRVSGPAAEGLAQYGGIWDHLGPESLSLPFSFTS